MNRKQQDVLFQESPPPYSAAVAGYPQQQQQQQYGNPQYPQHQQYLHHHHVGCTVPPGYNAVSQPIPKGGIVLAQPGAFPPTTQVVVANVVQNPPPDHMIFNIFMTLFCCWPIGIFAIVKSLACREAINRGNAEQALLLSGQARRLGYWTLGIGFLVFILSIVLLVIVYSL